jgi:uncharacterized protein (DUF1810 family)
LWDGILHELRAGRKTSHWMWFVFPQMAGLGRTEMAQRYAISSLDEAVRYLAEPTLGPRLRECCEVLLLLKEPSADIILGEIDAMKLRSSMTLFAAAAPDEEVFRDVLRRYFQGLPDDFTLRILQAKTPL